MPRDPAIHSLAGSLRSRTESYTSGIIPGGSLSSAAAIDVYRGSILENKLKALGSMFAVTQRFLGRNSFRRIGTDYLEGRIFPDYSLTGIAAEFASHIRDCGCTGTPDFTWELCALEYACHLAEERADTLPFDWPSFLAATRASVPLEFCISASSQMLAVSTNIETIWALHQQYADDADLPAVAAIGQPGHLLIWRPGLKSAVMRIDDAEAICLRRLLLAPASAEDLAVALQDAALECRLGRFLAKAVEHGWIDRVIFRPEGTTPSERA
jgi:hypothetical protein